MAEKELSDFLKGIDTRPVYRELDEAGYQYIAEENGYWLMKNTDDKPVIHYDPKTDTALQVRIVERCESYMGD